MLILLNISEENTQIANGDGQCQGQSCDCGCRERVFGQDTAEVNNVLFSAQPLNAIRYLVQTRLFNLRQC